MAKVKPNPENAPVIADRPPAKSMEERENQLIAAAVDLAEKQILEGTASSQVICHYLKLGSTKERLEKQLLDAQVELARQKADNLKSQQRTEELYKEAMEAFKSYNNGNF